MKSFFLAAFLAVPFICEASSIDYEGLTCLSVKKGEASIQFGIDRHGLFAFVEHMDFSEAVKIYQSGENRFRLENGQSVHEVSPMLSWDRPGGAKTLSFVYRRGDKVWDDRPIRVECKCSYRN